MSINESGRIYSDSLTSQLPCSPLSGDQISGLDFWHLDQSEFRNRAAVRHSVRHALMSRLEPLSASTLRGARILIVSLCTRSSP